MRGSPIRWMASTAIMTATLSSCASTAPTANDPFALRASIDSTGTWHMNAPDSYVAFAPDGRTLFTSSAVSTDPAARGVLTAWDLDSGEGRTLPSVHVGGIPGLAISPDGATLATGGYDGLVHLRNGRTGEPRATLRGHPSWVIRLAFSPDGTILATGSGGDPAYYGQNQVRLWNVATGELLSVLDWEYPESDVYAIAFSPDGTQLVTGSSFSGDPTMTGTDGTVTVWTLATGERERIYTDSRGAVLSVAFAPDGRTLAAGFWTRAIGLWEVGTWRPLGTLGGHSNWVMDLSFVREGTRLVSASGNPRDPALAGELLTWAPGASAPIARRETGGLGIRDISVSPDGGSVAAGLIGGGVRIWLLPEQP